MRSVTRRYCASSLGKGVPSFTVLLPALDAAGPPVELDKIVSPAVVCRLGVGLKEERGINHERLTVGDVEEMTVDISGALNLTRSALPWG